MKFKNLPEFCVYSNFKIDSIEANHTVCTVLLGINPDKAESFLSAAESRKEVEVTTDSGECVMKGIISAVSIDYGITSTTAEVTITSKSILVQEKSKERIFQNPKKKYSDILDQFEDVEIGKCDHVKDVVEEIIYQHNIDDFTFLIYLAHKCGTGIWITDEGKLSFGMINNKKSFSDSEKKYSKAVLEKTITADKNSRKINILTMEHIPNGSTLSNNGNEYTICEVHAYEKGDDAHFRYIGETKPSFFECEYNPEYLFTTAKVKDNKDPDNLGRIKVQFLEFEDKDSEKTWINFTTPFIGANKGGCVYLPDIDDTVFVCIANDKAYALNSIRTDALPENCQDISKKYFAIKNSIITIDDKKILAKQGDKSSCEIIEDSLTIKHDKSKTLLDDSTVTIQFDKSSVILSSDYIRSEIGKSKTESTSGEIKFENGNGKQSIKNGKTIIVGGQSSISLKDGKTELSGTNIDLSTQGVSL